MTYLPFVAAILVAAIASIVLWLARRDGAWSAEGGVEIRLAASHGWWLVAMAACGGAVVGYGLSAFDLSVAGLIGLPIVLACLYGIHVPLGRRLAFGPDGIRYRGGIDRRPRFRPWSSVRSIAMGPYAGDSVFTFAPGDKVTANTFIPGTYDLLGMAVAKGVPGAADHLRQIKLDTQLAPEHRSGR
jgi:hypothetical protein